MRDLIRYTLEDIRNWAYETYENLRDWFLGLDVRISERSQIDQASQPPMPTELANLGNERLAKVVLTQLFRVAPDYLLVPVELVYALRKAVAPYGSDYGRDPRSVLAAARALLEAVDSAESVSESVSGNRETEDTMGGQG